MGPAGVGCFPRSRREAAKDQPGAPGSARRGLLGVESLAGRASGGPADRPARLRHSGSGTKQYVDKRTFRCPPGGPRPHPRRPLFPRGPAAPPDRRPRSGAVPALHHRRHDEHRPAGGPQALGRAGHPRRHRRGPGARASSSPSPTPPTGWPPRTCSTPSRSCARPGPRRSRSAAVRIGARLELHLDRRRRIAVDGVAVTTPYQILAIGDPPTLATAMDIPGGVSDTAKRAGGTPASGSSSRS